MIVPNISPRLALGIAGGLVLAALLAWGFYWKAQAAHNLAKADACLNASKLAAEANARMKAAQEQKYKDIAHDADEKHAAELAEARSAVDEYIRTHRAAPSGVRTARVSAPESASSPDTSVPEEVPSDSIVVTETDVRACNDAIEYAWAAHGWAATLNTPIVEAQP